MRPVALLALAVGSTALLSCASGRGGRSDVCGGGALDSAYLAGGPVYRECEVDEPAKLVTPPPRPPAPTTHWDVREGCVRAEVEFVVDESGVPVTEPVRIVSSNSSHLAQMLRRAVPEMRFRPAMREGKAVRQLVRYGIGLVTMTTTRGAVAGVSGADLPRGCR